MKNQNSISKPAVISKPVSSVSAGPLTKKDLSLPTHPMDFTGQSQTTLNEAPVIPLTEKVNNADESL